MQLIYLCKISYFVYKFSKKSSLFFTSIRNIGYKILGLNVDNLREHVADDDKITRKEEVLEKEGNVCGDSFVVTPKCRGRRATPKREINER